MTSHGDRRRVGEYVQSRRGALKLSQEDLAQRAGVNSKTIYSLEKGARWPIARSRAAIERALGWAEGDLQRVADGLEPTPSLPANHTDAEEEAARKALMDAAGTPAFAAVAEDYIARLPPVERRLAEELFRSFAESQRLGQEAAGRAITQFGHRRNARNGSDGASEAQQ